MPLHLANDLTVHLTKWINNDIHARIVVERDMQILWMNFAASRILSGSATLFIRNGKLSLLEEDQSRTFLAFIRGARGHPTSMMIKSHSQQDILCVALALGDDGGDAVTGLMFRPSTWFLKLDSATLQTEFGLTTAEHRVIEALFSGLTADEVAADQAISVGTVRAHIRHIYDKLGVGSREALFHKVLQFSLDF